MTRPGAGGLVLACLGLILSIPGAARAQPAPASAFVAPDHWALDAARRLHGLGLMPPGYDPASLAQSWGEIREGLRAAAGASALAAAYLHRLEEELGGAPGKWPEHVTRLGIGAERVRGAVAAGIGLPGEPDETGPVPYATRSTPVAMVEHWGALQQVAWGGRGSLTDAGMTLEEAYGRVDWSRLAFWAGKRSVGYPTGPGQGIVLTRTPQRFAVGLETAEPFRFPGVLRGLGPVRVSTALMRAYRNAALDNPWIWTSRLLLEPHPRLQGSITRGVMFGGEGNQELTLRSFLYMLIGKHSGGFDDQLVSVSLRYRPPTEAAMPLVAYLEWGLEDSAGAWKDTPGILVGLEAPALPFAPEVSLGGSFTSFSGACCGNPYWYRNFRFRGGWTDDGFHLGHPLGGHGREARLYGRADVAEARLQLTAAGFARDRGRENLYAPHREGGSIGGVFGLTVPGAGRSGFLELLGESALDGDWDEVTARAGLRFSL